MVRTIKPSSALEVGTLQSVPDRPTHSRFGFPFLADSQYVKCDIAPGPDVDVVADVHCLPAEWTDKYGAFIANAVWEHLKRPWIAAKEVARILSPGGIFLIESHQTFPIHGYPSDYFRFSKEALTLILEDAGLEISAIDYIDRTIIIPPPHIVPPEHVESWNLENPSYLIVMACGRKPA
jgi:SAM-dependent methyltransferase